MSTNRSRRQRTEYTLPSADEIGHTLRGKHIDAPLCGQVRKLLQLHRYRRRHPLNSSEIDCRRAELVAQIEDWLHGYAIIYGLVPDPALSSSFATLLDRMAAAAARALDKLVAAGPSDPATRAAWARLAEIEREYVHMIGALSVSRAG
ncbi:hypothetical protein [Nocardia brasiliensis]